MPQPTHTGVRPVHIPGLSDLISFGRSTYEGPDERRHRVRSQFADMRDTVIPEWRRDMSRVHIFLDNLEDLATTLGLAGRFALRYLPRLTPVVRGILAVDAILNAGVLLLRLGYPGSLKKAKTLKTAVQNPKGWLKNAMDDAKPLKAWPHWTVWLEVAQTADYLTGNGLILGPIYGAIEEATFRGIQKGTAALQEGYLTEGQREAWTAIQSQLNNPGPPDPDLIKNSNLPVDMANLTDYIKAVPGYDTVMRGLDAFVGLAHPDNPLPQDTQTRMLGQAAAGAQFLADQTTDGIRVNLTPTARGISRVNVPAGRQSDPITVATLRQLGVPPSTDRRWLLPGSPYTIIPDAWGTYFRERFQQWADVRIAAETDPDRQTWIGTTVQQMGDDLLRAATSSYDATTATPEPALKVLGLLLERNLDAHPLPTAVDLHSIAQTLIAQGANPGRMHVTTRELAEVFRANQIHLSELRLP